jgi:ER-bound oxygenase mpaB/B'/Rubber oxygenase, catalytic domain
VPISQSDALITLMSSSLTPGLAMHLMSYRTSIREIEAMMHYWRYIGHLLGVQPR